MYIREVSVPKGIGLHSKLVTYFIDKARVFKSFVWLKRNKTLVDAKNLFEVLSLGIDGGMLIEISADGVDEEQAVEELVDFIKNLS